MSTTVNTSNRYLKRRILCRGNRAPRFSNREHSPNSMRRVRVGAACTLRHVRYSTESSMRRDKPMARSLLQCLQGLDFELLHLMASWMSRLGRLRLGFLQKASSILTYPLRPECGARCFVVTELGELFLRQVVAKTRVPKTLPSVTAEGNLLSHHYMTESALVDLPMALF
jgi:hypothetical protein